jgi:uridylate kinase
MEELKYRRILLKLSGEALGDQNGEGHQSGAGRSNCLAHA